MVVRQRNKETRSEKEILRARKAQEEAETQARLAATRDNQRAAVHFNK
jgi:hypothetical protein